MHKIPRPLACRTVPVCQKSPRKLEVSLEISLGIDRGSKDDKQGKPNEPANKSYCTCLLVFHRDWNGLGLRQRAIRVVSNKLFAAQLKLLLRTCKLAEYRVQLPQTALRGDELSPCVRQTKHKQVKLESYAHCTCLA